MTSLLLAAVLAVASPEELGYKCKYINIQGRRHLYGCGMIAPPRQKAWCDTYTFTDHMGHKHRETLCTWFDIDVEVKSS